MCFWLAGVPDSYVRLLLNLDWCKPQSVSLRLTLVAAADVCSICCCVVREHYLLLNLLVLVTVTAAAVLLAAAVHPDAPLHTPLISICVTSKAHCTAHNHRTPPLHTATACRRGTLLATPHCHCI
jgi:hypothetical protein